MKENNKLFMDELFSDNNSTQSQVNKLTCRTCKHNQAWQYCSKVFHYCGIRKSKLTFNKLLKIRCKDIACILYEKK